MADKFVACIKLSRILMLHSAICGPQKYTLEPQHYIGNTAPALFPLLSLKDLHQELNTLMFQSVFHSNNMKMVYLFLNMRNLLSFQHICVSNHGQFQLSVITISGYYIPLLPIKWYWTLSTHEFTKKWGKNIAEQVLCGPRLSVPR